MADSADAQEQKHEMVRSGLGGAAAEGAVSALLHKSEREQQVKDTFAQQDAALQTAQKFEPRK